MNIKIHRECRLSWAAGLFAAALLLFGTIQVSAQGTVPTIELRDGVPTLVLPEALAQLIASEFPDHRVPAAANLVGEWQEAASESNLPFMALGDFDGNNLTDVALFLMRPGLWKLVAFHQVQPGEYQAHEFTQFMGPDRDFVKFKPPQTFSLTTLPAGQSRKPEGEPGPDVTVRELDSIVLALFDDEASAYIYQWRTSTERYRVVVVGTAFGD